MKHFCIQGRIILSYMISIFGSHISYNAFFFFQFLLLLEIGGGGSLPPPSVGAYARIFIKQKEMQFPGTNVLSVLQSTVCLQRPMIT
jgi:hypothetical protein